MKNAVIVGKGGFARETRWILDRRRCNSGYWNFCGYIDNETEGEEILGDDSYLLKIKEKIDVFIAIGNPAVRMKLYEKYKENANIQFPNLIDPAVGISESVQLGYGNIICANNVLTVDINIGNFNIINLGCTVGHDVQIGDFNTINPGTNISGNVKIDDLTEIGTGTKIIQGKNIGKGAVLAAGTVITKDVPNSVMVAGVPGIVKKTYIN